MTLNGNFCRFVDPITIIAVEVVVRDVLYIFLVDNFSIRRIDLEKLVEKDHVFMAIKMMVAAVKEN